MSSSPNFVLFPKNESDINGIIHYIPSISVNAESSSIDNDNPVTSGPMNAVTPSSQYPWCSKNMENQWITINFPGFELYISHYSIQSPNFGINSYHPKQWIVEGFQSANWIKIDEVTESLINGPLLIQTRSITNIGPFSSFRITSTGANWRSSLQYYYHCIMLIDFFGLSTHQILETPQCKSSIIVSSPMNLIILFAFALFSDINP